MTYLEFIERKSQGTEPSGFNVTEKQLNKHLFPFQKAIVRWALRRGKSAIFASCGLGKTACQLAWADAIVKKTKSKVLIIAPLAVGPQTVRESEKFGIKTRFTKNGNALDSTRIVVTNYESLHKFNANDFVGVVLDESSILKSFASATRSQIIEKFARTPYKLACTATPSPNDYMELGNHAEFLGVMSRQEMLAMYFINDGSQTQKWRLKGHAESGFWQWVAGWAATIERPSDIGFDDEGYNLPELIYHNITVDVELQPEEGQLFKMEAGDLMERRRARRESIADRVAECAKLVNASTEQWLIWCDLNDEGDQLTANIDGAVQVAGKHSDEQKEIALAGFIDGSIRVLVSKPAICGFGMNMQNCHNMTFVGLSDSYESLHQAVRRCWRFGQIETVNCYIITASSEGAVLRNIKRKEKDAIAMTEEMVKYVTVHQDMGATSKQSTSYEVDRATGNGWDIHLGDCVDVATSIDSELIDYTIFSPPFISLYVFSDSDRDMGNCNNPETFFKHFSFLVEQLYRITKSGRLVSFHCMNLPMSKQNDGNIGLKDFRGDLIRLFESHGFIYHSEVVIWKDPVVAMQRTKTLGLLHKQLKKDSSMSRQGIPDYLVTMRKPGANSSPIAGKLDYFVGETDHDFPTEPSGDVDDRTSINIWQRYASPVWMDINQSETLQKESARDDRDERHISPLQLGVIERALQLWTNPNDLVFSPFAGIGSEGFVAIKTNRRFIGAELKRSYYRQAALNLARAEQSKYQLSLFD